MENVKSGENGEGHGSNKVVWRFKGQSQSPFERDRLLTLFSQRKTVFTGLVAALGKIQPQSGDRFTITVGGQNAGHLLQDVAIGDSVAVDGVCLTVEEILSAGFVATASGETLQRTRLGQMTPGVDWANLELSLRAGSKLGGHFVTGHVDGIGCLVEARNCDTAWEMTFAPVPTLREQWEQYIARYLVSKGSIAVNGISLTIAECDRQGSWFRVAVIPHTYHHTNLRDLKPGSWVNIEGDILGKYVEKLLGYRLSEGNPAEEISLAFLAEHGYS